MFKLKKFNFKLLISLFVLNLYACSYFQTQNENIMVRTGAAPIKVVTAPSERELNFAEAEKHFNAGDFDRALPLYFKIVRDSFESSDAIYEKSLLSLAQLYEKSDQPEKAILAYDELFKHNTTVISKTSLRIALMKNHYRVTNYYQAQLIKNEIDADYKAQAIGVIDLYNALYYQTDLFFDRHIFDELTFIGDIQKYFVFVVESDRALESEKLTDLLILYYNRFTEQLDNQILTSTVKKKLVVLLLDQLSKFDRYKLFDNQDKSSNLSRFSSFAELNKKKLTERLANGKL